VTLSTHVPVFVRAALQAVVAPPPEPQPQAAAEPVAPPDPEPVDPAQAP